MKSRLISSKTALSILVIVGSFNFSSPAFTDTSENTPQTVLHDIYYLELRQLLSFQMEVETATGSSQPLKDAPAIMSIITKDDIDLWRFGSIAEALDTIPGFYCVYDFLSYNCGVRGVNSGLRAYSRSIKVLVNGRPINFRSDGANFLGPEFIPMNNIKQIEIIRGPASALYGADAFLGVVNIVTLSAKDKGRQVSRMDAYADSWQESTGFGASLSLISGDENRGAVFSLQANRTDRSKHEVSSSSPNLDDFSGNDNTESRNDFSTPITALTQAHWRIADHLIGVDFHYSRLDSDAEFLDFGQLSHANHVSLEQYSIGLSDHWQLHEKLSLLFSLATARGNPTSQEELNFGSLDTFAKRKFGFESTEGVIEAKWKLTDRQHVTLGIDYLEDDEELLEVFSVDAETLQETAQTTPQSNELFTNKGYYIQYLNTFIDALDITINMRSDDHNIYGSVDNYRLGAVYRFTPFLSSKLLYGTSFKAPSANQLFAKPLFAGEVNGNSQLDPETASTVEAGLNWVVNDDLTLSTNGYYTEVDDKIELVNVGPNQTPRNIGQDQVWGLELEAGWRVSSKQIVGFNSAYSNAENTFEDPFIGDVTKSTSLFPRQTANLIWQYQFDKKSQLGLRWRYASARRASQSNIKLLDEEAYSLDSYQLLNLIYHYSNDQGANYFLKVENLIDTEYEEPGSNGIDIPGKSRRIILGISHAF